MSMTRRIPGSRLPLLVGACALLASACGLVHEALEIHGPIVATVTVSGVDPATVHAALFDVKLTLATGADGEEERTLSLEVHDRGRIDLGTELTLPRDTPIEPLQAADGAVGEVTFTLPELTESTRMIAAVWIDEDGDGKLTVRADGTLEPAFSPSIEHMLVPYYLTFYSFDTDPEGYLGVATASGGTDLILEDEHLDRFKVEIVAD